MEVQPDGTLQPVVPDNSKPVPDNEPQVEPVMIEPQPAPDPNVSLPRATRNKWADLPRQDHPTRVHAVPAHYENGSSEQEINTAINQKNQHHAYIAFAEDPRTYAEAMASPYSKEWEKALRVEVKQLEDTETIQWINRDNVPKDRSLIDGLIVWKTKRDGSGEILKHKARAVARGFMQVPGQDYNKTYASTARYTTICALMSLAACEDWEIHQFDVNGAYLKGDLEEDIYMEVPDGVDMTGHEGMVWKLLKPIYGLKQSGRQFKKKRDKTMAELGFSQCTADDNLYSLQENDKTILLVLAYIDDTIPAGPDLNHITKFKQDLMRVWRSPT